MSSSRRNSCVGGICASVCGYPVDVVVVVVGVGHLVVGSPFFEEGEVREGPVEVHVDVSEGFLATDTRYTLNPRFSRLVWCVCLYLCVFVCAWARACVWLMLCTAPPFRDSTPPLRHEHAPRKYRTVRP